MLESVLEQSVETKVKTEKMYLDDKDINFIVLAIDNPALSGAVSSFETSICGKPMIDYVINACNKAPTIKRVEVKHNLLEEIKPLLNDSEWTVVLYSDTPLIKNATITSAFSLAEEKWLNVCKLTRGYILKTEYVKHIEEIFGVETYYFDEEDFMIASSYKQVSLINDIMRNRIADYLMKNKVKIVDPSTTFIDSDVVVDEGTIIEPFTKLTGKVEIGKCCYIKSNSVIINSKIFDNVVISNSVVKNSVVSNGAKIANFSTIENSFIGAETEIANSNLNFASVGNNCLIGYGSKLISTGNRIKIMDKSILLENVVVKEGIVVGQNCKINSGIIVNHNLVADTTL